VPDPPPDRIAPPANFGTPHPDLDSFTRLVAASGLFRSAALKMMEYRIASDSYNSSPYRQVRQIEPTQLADGRRQACDQRFDTCAQLALENYDLICAKTSHTVSDSRASQALIPMAKIRCWPGISFVAQRPG